VEPWEKKWTGVRAGDVVRTKILRGDGCKGSVRILKTLNYV
jgi:hypothetical protein